MKKTVTREREDFDIIYIVDKKFPLRLFSGPVGGFSFSVQFKRGVNITLIFPFPLSAQEQR